MEEQIQEYLYNPTVGKIVSFLIGIAWMLIKILKKSFLKLRTINRYKAKKFSSFIGYFLTIILLTVVLVINLGT
jgi:small-conductance mechanosensitive channel